MESNFARENLSLPTMDKVTCWSIGHGHLAVERVVTMGISGMVVLAGEVARSPLVSGAHRED